MSHFFLEIKDYSNKHELSVVLFNTMFKFSRCSRSKNPPKIRKIHSKGYQIVPSGEKILPSGVKTSYTGSF